MGKITLPDVVGRAARRLDEQQTGHSARARAELAVAQAEALASMDPAQRRVVQSKQRIASYGYRPDQRVLDGEPHPERALKTAEGVESVPLLDPVPGAPTPTRSRVRAPLTLRTETAEALALAIHDIMIHGDRAKMSTEAAVQGKGTLDAALNDSEKDALERFVHDVMMIQRAEIRISNYGEQFAPPDRNKVNAALSRMNYIQDNLPLKHWEALVIFGKHMLCLHEEGLPTVLHIGMERAASTDQRVGRGAYIGQMGTIAQGLHEAYLAFSIVQQRRRSGLIGSPVLEAR